MNITYAVLNNSHILKSDSLISKERVSPTSQKRFEIQTRQIFWVWFCAYARSVSRAMIIRSERVVTNKSNRAICTDQQCITTREGEMSAHLKPRESKRKMKELKSELRRVLYL